MTSRHLFFWQAPFKENGFSGKAKVPKSTARNEQKVDQVWPTQHYDSKLKTNKTVNPNLTLFDRRLITILCEED